MESQTDPSFLIQLIKKQPLFAPLKDEEITELASLFAEVKVEPGTVIVKEGDSVDSVYLIGNGTADVRHVENRDGGSETKSIAILSFGDSIGLNETGFYSISGNRTATVIALTEMIIYRLGVPAFRGFALSHTHVSEVMNKNSSKVFDLE